MSRIQALFDRKAGAPAFTFFVTAGYPEIGSTPELVLTLERSGADMIELGMPFSDPLADGPTIQLASETAIANGTTIAGIFGMVKEIRAASEIPLVLMGYVNPVMRYGLARFFRDAAEAGADGVILPDVPLEEAAAFKAACMANGLDLIQLVAPTTPDARMRAVDEASSGFVYCVSVTGVTGARDGADVAASVEGFKDRVKANIRKNPVQVGFGIRSHEDAKRMVSGFQGVIIGSALIDAIRTAYPAPDWMRTVSAFVRSITQGPTSP